MLIPLITTLRTEDFKGQEEWITKLLFPLNQLFTSAVSAINGNLTFGDNVPCQTQTLSFVSTGTSDFPKTFKWNYQTRPVELRVCSATENGTAVALIPAWSYANAQVTLTGFFKVSSTNTSALTSGATYSVVLRVQP